MKKIFSSQNLLFITLAAAPLYLLKVSFFNLPTNVLELLIVLNLITNLQLIIKTKRVPSWQIIFSALLILIGVIVSLWLSDNKPVGLGILKGWFLLPMLFAYALFTNLNSKDEIKKAFFYIYFSSMIIAVIALIYKALSLVSYDGRLSAIYESPNYLAFYLAPGLIISLYFAHESISSKGIKSYNSLFHILSFFFITLSLYFTYSYGAILAILTALFLSAILFKKDIHYLIYSIIILFILLSSLAISNADKFINLFSERSSVSSRLMIWRSAETLIVSNPLFGIGAGNFQSKYLSLQPLYPPYLEWAVPHPHNIFMAFWLGSGIMGLAGFIFLMIYLIFILIKNSEGNIYQHLALIAFFLYILLHGLVDTPIWKNDLALVFWTMIAISAAIIKIKHTENKKTHP